MQVIIDAQGRVEIPEVLRERLHLLPGAVVELEPLERGLQVTPVSDVGDLPVGSVKVTREESLLVLQGFQPVTIGDVNRMIDLGRAERFDTIVNENAESR